MIKKLKTIIFSRFKKPNLESFVIDRRKKCKYCSFNSKNSGKIPIKMRILNYLSDLFTFLSPAKETEDLGQCIHPKCGCNLFFKTQEEVEVCPINKWKK